MKKVIIKNNKGMTLVELLVSMGIFAVVMTLTVSFFISLQKLQATYRDRADLHQEGRIASEIFSRYTREAKSVTMIDDAGNTVTGLGAFPGLCVGGSANIKLEMLDGTTLKFRCNTSGTNNRLQMSSCSPVDCYSDISSGQVHVQGLTLERSVEKTYPKTLRYNLEVWQSVTSTGDGEKIMFPGYLVMRNEL
jgi:prepilin-type N-terminal cleavage/methylation domain-containing protein